MEYSKIIETLGGLAKEETLVNVGEKIMPGSFVLETEEPYPGYHGANLPTDSKPRYIFLVTRKKYSTEKILRVNQNIKKYFHHSFDAVPGAICLEVDTLPCLRIRDLDNYQLIEDLQKGFISEGIQFAKKRDIKSAKCIITLKKHFRIQEIDEGIYKDLDESSTFYLQIFNQVKWGLFVEITQNIRNNIDNSNFDAAIAAIYTRNVMDVVRIFSVSISLDNLKMLRDKYLAEIEKVF